MADPTKSKKNILHKDWRWVIIYTLFLYASLPFGRSVLTLLKNLMGSGLGLCVNLLLVLIGVIFLASLLFNRTRTWYQVGTFVSISLVMAFLVGKIEIPEERIHLLQYGGLGYLTLSSLQCYPTNFLIYSSAFGFVLLVGCGDELIQWLLPNRVFDLRDILFNILGGVGGIVIQANTGSQKHDKE